MPAYLSWIVCRCLVNKVIETKHHGDATRETEFFWHRDKRTHDLNISNQDKSKYWAVWVKFRFPQLSHFIYLNRNPTYFLLLFNSKPSFFVWFRILIMLVFPVYQFLFGLSQCDGEQYFLIRSHPLRDVMLFFPSICQFSSFVTLM